MERYHEALDVSWTRVDLDRTEQILLGADRPVSGGKIIEETLRTISLVASPYIDVNVSEQSMISRVAIGEPSQEWPRIFSQRM